MKSVQKIDLGLTGYDELFMNDAERKENKLPRIYDIPLSEIDDFPDHPFKVKLDEDKFEDVTVLGHPMLFTCLRVDRDTVPQGMYMYEVRHDDDQQGEPVQIANWIMVNHWGTLISNRPIRKYCGQLR